MTHRIASLPGPDLIRAASRFASLRLWEYLDFDDTIAFRVPGETHPVFGVVMGQAGEEFGMTLTTGPQGLWHLQQLIYAGQGDEELFYELSLWGVTLTRPSELPPQLRKALKTSSVKLPRGSKIPMVMIMEAGKIARSPTVREEEIVVYCLNGLLNIHDDDGFEPTPFDPAKGILTLTLSGASTDPQIVMDIRTYAMIAPVQAVPSFLPPDAVRQAPRIVGSWIVGFPIAPMEIADDDRVVRVLLVVDAESGMILRMDAMFGDQLDKAVEALFGLFQGTAASPIRGLPQEIIFASRQLFDTLGQAMKVMGIRCRFEDCHPAWIEAWEGLRTFAHGPGVRR